jgi:hypothetical protein
MATSDWSFAWDLAWGHVATKALLLIAWSAASAHVSRPPNRGVRTAGRMGLTGALLWLIVATLGLLTDGETLAWYGQRVTAIELSLLWGAGVAGVLGGTVGLVAWRSVPAVLTLVGFWYLNIQACTIHGFDMAARCGVPFARWQSEGFASAQRTFLDGLAADVIVALAAAGLVQAVTNWLVSRGSRPNKPYGLLPEVSNEILITK